MTPIISASELLQLYPLDELILIDVSNGKDARSHYETKHLNGALFVDLNSQLADIKDNVAEGGRHPLPSVTAFTKTLSELGITPKSHVVVYDDKNGSNAAARFWWMLKAVGHEKIQVLDGGFQAAEKVHFPINALLPAVTPSALYPISDWQLPRATMDEVERVVQDDQHIVIDVRDAARYRGETEPIDLVAGHIPGAINIPFTENLDANGLFLPSEVLKENYQKAFGTTPSENIIFHCGSGVTACHSLLAIAQAGMEIPKLYVGSWSEWSRNNKAIATK
ncbi:sulfurtransferase [Flavobacterium sp. GCM10027622]|uniref:sulfurtransferase n=1 Tax=unclassified Flavobacterium TaxID=196869 RepID=UPI003623C76F